MREKLQRLTLVDERCLKKNMMAHQIKLRQAKPAIDCLPPPVYGHVKVKLKKLQIEKERICKIEDENQRLLSRLSAIMNRGQVKARRLSSSHDASSGRASKSPLRRQQERACSTNVAISQQNVQIARVRPHTVPVVRNATMHPTGSLMSSTATTPHKKRLFTPFLCGCASRAQNIKSMPSKMTEPVTNDDQQLICGIQSVKITLKSPSKEDLNKAKH